MNAIDMLEQQHRQVEKLFAEVQKASGEKKRKAFLTGGSAPAWYGPA